MVLLQQSNVLGNVGFTGDALLPTVAALLSITAGTMFLVWLGEMITERGIGNGISLIIFAGIVAGFPSLLTQGSWTGTTCWASASSHHWRVDHLPHRAFQRGAPPYSGAVRAQHLPRGADVPPERGDLPAAAHQLGGNDTAYICVLNRYLARHYCHLPSHQHHLVGDVANFFAVLLEPTSPLYWVMVFVLVVLFTFFYTLVIFNQQNLAENLQRNGGFVLGIRPGKPTQDYLNRVIVRITMGGALFLGFIAIVPYLASLVTDVQAISLSSTSLLIMVGVGLDTLRQLEAQLTMRNYEGFLR